MRPDLYSVLPTVHSSLANSITLIDVAAVIATIWALRGAFRVARRTLRTTRLRGPPRTDFVFGLSKQVIESTDNAALYEAWAGKYGVVYEVPTTLGGRKIMLSDPRALTHFFSKEAWSYVLTDETKLVIRRIFGPGIMWAQGEDHKRQRKSLTPAFSQAAIGKFTPIFYDSAHKVKVAWDTMIETSGSDNIVVKVQNWMNHISLDSIGLACFSHDFGSLDGKPAPVAEAFDTVASSSMRSAVDIGLFLLSEVFPFLAYLPTPRIKSLLEMRRTMEDISKKLLARIKKEKEGILDGKEESSIIGMLMKANDSNSDLQSPPGEVLAQMKILLAAGYETTSIAMTWALLELARNPSIQNKLRQELLAFGEEPTYKQLQSNLPYLDAVVHEILRVHPPVPDLTRVAVENDIIPVSESVITKSGEVVNSISIAPGTRIGIPISAINKSISIWGSDAKVFQPERWLKEDGIPRKAQDIQAYRHLLSFADGPKICIGKGFALTEFKVVMSVLVRNFVFELRDGHNTRVEHVMGLLPRPKIVGEQGIDVPLRVRRYEG
ncbi:cytochrome P450 [Pisolithus croceorrhizus]|nr:cytochrome P450 [Pisolithus croceorrhizus]